MTRARDSHASRARDSRVARDVCAQSMPSMSHVPCDARHVTFGFADDAFADARVVDDDVSPHQCARRCR